NGFVARIAAQDGHVDVYQAVEPVGVVLETILSQYVRDTNLDRVVQGALIGMMSSLDRHSSFITAEELTAMREDTKGEFEGIGVSIRLDDNKNIVVFKPVPDSPAETAGIRPFDIIIKIDDISTEGMSLSDAADKIRGQRGTTVKLTIRRKNELGVEEVHEFNVKRAKVPLESIVESRMIDGDIGYVRISDFKDNTSRDLRKALRNFMDAGMKGFILDLRWNPGGLLSASQETCELFLPRNSLVTYTRGRVSEEGKPAKDDMRLYTEGRPVIPLQLPMMVLVNGQTASSAEIVTGALQYHKRAIVVGQKTFGKGSVQTIIPLERPKMTAMRLTTALYYTPADVSIDHQGILPDVEVVMSTDEERTLLAQMYRSYESDPSKVNEQNHGAVTGDEVGDASFEASEVELQLLEEIRAAYGEEAHNLLQEFVSRLKIVSATVQDRPLQRAVEILREDTVWDNLLQKYHKDVQETQVAANAEVVSKLPETERELLSPGQISPQTLPPLPELPDVETPDSVPEEEELIPIP
ncbi:MAG TPA: S41 family peptidase, partial [Candidatus Hydrogenedentes bacterium]|nr:S41 family peptidase [Candidatus Hydrogenedentota bacterium]